MREVVKELTMLLPMIPVSANHYLGIGRIPGRFFVRKEADRFRQLVAAFCSGRCVEAKQFELQILVLLPAKARLDVGNAEKLVSDALQKAGAFVWKGKPRTDSYVCRLVVEKRRSTSDGATFIRLRPLEQLLIALPNPGRT
jgi:Holliday junction resolvase RusA-like endonuclease